MYYLHVAILLKYIYYLFCPYWLQWKSMVTKLFGFWHSSKCANKWKDMRLSIDDRIVIYAWTLPLIELTNIKQVTRNVNTMHHYINRFWDLFLNKKQSRCHGYLGKRISPVRPIWVTEKACCEKHCGSYWFSKNPEATRKTLELFSAQNTFYFWRPSPIRDIFLLFIPRKIIEIFFCSIVDGWIKSLWRYVERGRLSREYYV